ncbi:uncharacterized protein LOC107264549 isoform X2 [Cephus cinctus]|uniref:Uncharacterized protein LOC107264549 isoform X2 n=1 Tax=Cephus cinctus TaxID=211228 RepID=A0AAJ7BKQ3_CEPCN|nr:uncharacterized protein LOC107264549 isoform X2 [Cephus cinctus]
MVPRADKVLGSPLFTTVLTLLLVVQITGSFPYKWFGFGGSSPFQNDEPFSPYRSPLQRPTFLKDSEDDDYVPIRYTSDTRLPEDAAYRADQPKSQATLSARIGESGRTYDADENTELVQRAIENRDLLSLEEWRESVGENPSKGFQRDTSSYQNTRDVKLTLGSTGDSSNYSSSQSQGKTRSNVRREYNPRMSGMPTAMDSMQADEKIVFPSEENESQAHRFVPGPASICKDNTYCEHSPDYPEGYIQTAIREQENLKYFTGVDEVVNIIQRIDSPLEDTQLCVSTEQVIIPKSAENREKQWRYIVNHGNVTQGVRIEKCQNEDSECRIFDSVPNGYKTSCKQKYIYRQLMALMANGSVSPDLFRFPASCCCHAKFTGNVLTRMGMNFGKTNQTST